MVDMFVVVVDIEACCFEVGCFDGIFGFVVMVVDNWLDLGEDGVSSKVVYL